MNKPVFKSKISQFLLVAVLSISLGACSLVSVANITSAGNNKIVNLGDSIFALSGKISDYLHSYAGKTFRRYCTSGAYFNGTSILTSFSVYNQYAKAKSDYSTIDTIFMDGGGNASNIRPAKIDVNASASGRRARGPPDNFRATCPLLS